MIDENLIKMLVCPACKSNVRLDGEKIVCIKCGRRYPIRSGIPVMLIDEAEEGGDKGGKQINGGKI